MDSACKRLSAVCVSPYLPPKGSKLPTLVVTQNKLSIHCYERSANKSINLCRFVLTSITSLLSRRGSRFICTRCVTQESSTSTPHVRSTRTCSPFCWGTIPIVFRTLLSSNSVVLGALDESVWVPSKVGRVRFVRRRQDLILGSRNASRPISGLRRRQVAHDRA